MKHDPCLAAALALACTAMAATETKTIIREDCERFAPGQSLPGTIGAAKGASIAVGADHRSGASGR